MAEFDQKAVEQAADREVYKDIQWIQTESGLSFPEIKVINKQSFVSGARYQFGMDQYDLIKKDQEILELKKFKEDAIRMAAEFHIRNMK